MKHSSGNKRKKAKDYWPLQELYQLWSFLKKEAIRPINIYIWLENKFM